MTVKQRVKNILSASKEARKYPKELCIIYMQKSGMNLTEEQKVAFRDMDDLWTVRRSAQQLVNSGEIKLEDEVVEYRYERYKEETANYSARSAEELLEAQGYVIEED